MEASWEVGHWATWSLCIGRPAKAAHCAVDNGVNMNIVVIVMKITDRMKRTRRSIFACCDGLIMRSLAVITQMKLPNVIS